jgi:hypothetical protein
MGTPFFLIRHLIRLPYQPYQRRAAGLKAPRNIIYACIKSGTRAAWYARVKPGYSPAPHWSLRKNIFFPLPYTSTHCHIWWYISVYKTLVLMSVDGRELTLDSAQFRG